MRGGDTCCPTEASRITLASNATSCATPIVYKSRLCRGELPWAYSNILQDHAGIVIGEVIWTGREGKIPTQVQGAPCLHTGAAYRLRIIHRVCSGATVSSTQSRNHSWWGSCNATARQHLANRQCAGAGADCRHRQ